MPFNDGECILEPQKNALHYWDAAASKWVEWTGDANNTLYKVQAPVKATGAAALAWADALAPAFDFNFIGMTVHLSAAGGAGCTNFTITQDGVTAGDDVVHFSQDMTVLADISFFPAVPIPFVQGDALDIAYSNANARTYWVTLWYSRRY